MPNLVGLEVSQFLLKEILKKIEVKGYNSKKSLLHQIFRRYGLIVQNNLNNDDVKERSKILKESFEDHINIAINSDNTLEMICKYDPNIYLCNVRYGRTKSHCISLYINALHRRRKIFRHHKRELFNNQFI